MMEAVHTSETTVYSNETTQRYIPDGSNHHIRRGENLKSHTLLPLQTVDLLTTECVKFNEWPQKEPLIIFTIARCRLVALLWEDNALCVLGSKSMAVTKTPRGGASKCGATATSRLEKI
jgi:hypothetical protein